METLKEQLKDVELHRNMLKNRRKKDGIITVAIVGYTNAGKSTLMEVLREGDGSSIGKGTQRTTKDVRSYPWKKSSNYRKDLYGSADGRCYKDQ